jgi:hypothetical protein
MKRLILAACLIVSLALFSGCGGCQGQGGNSTNSSSAQATPDLSMIKIKMGDKVQLDSPEKFVEVFILFNYEYIKWVKDINSNTNLAGSGEEYLGRKREEFYRNLGLTEEKFSQYGSQHFKEIDLFLEKNPVYKKTYEDSLKLIY